MRVLFFLPFRLSATLAAALITVAQLGAQPNTSLRYRGARPETEPHNFKMAEDPGLRLKLGLPGQNFQQRGIVINWPEALLPVQGKTVVPQLGHVTWIQAAAFTPDGLHLISSAGTGCFDVESVIKVWRVSDGVLVREVRGHFKEVHALDMTPDGRIVSGSKDTTIKIWTLEGKEIRTISVHSDAVTHVRVSRDGRRILSASKDKTSKLIDASSGGVIKTFDGHTDVVYSADISPDGKRFVTGSFDKTARVWDETGRNIFTLQHPNAVYSAAYSPDGRYIATGSEDRNVRLYDASTGRLLGTTQMGASPTHVVFASNGSLIASEQVLAVPSLTKTQDLAHAGMIAVHPDGKTLALGSRRQIGRFELASLAQPSQRRPLGTIANRVSHFNVAHDGRIFTTLDAMRILDPRTGKLIALRDGNEYYYLAHLSPDGKSIAAASYREAGSVSLYEASTGKLRNTLRGHPGQVTRMAFSKDSRLLATSDEKAIIRIWEDGRSLSVIHVSGAEETPGLSGHIGFPSLDFSPNGRMLVASWNDDRNIVGVFDVSGREIAKIKWQYQMNEARFLDNERIIVSGYRSRESAVFRLDGTQVGTLAGHDGAMTTVAVSPNGRTLVSTGLDKQILVWDAANFFFFGSCASSFRNQRTMTARFS